MNKMTYKIEVKNENGNISYVQDENKTSYFTNLDDARNIARLMNNSSLRCTYTVVDGRYGHRV